MLGYRQYAQDYDNQLPPLGSFSQTRAALSPYLKDDRVWLCKDGTDCIGSFVQNPAVSGHKISDFPAGRKGYNRAVLAYADRFNITEEETETRLVGFMDGSVETVSESRFQSLLRQTATDVANADRHGESDPQSPTPRF